MTQYISNGIILCSSHVQSQADVSNVVKAVKAAHIVSLSGAGTMPGKWSAVTSMTRRHKMMPGEDIEVYSSVMADVKARHIKHKKIIQISLQDNFTILCNQHGYIRLILIKQLRWRQEIYDFIFIRDSRGELYC